MSFLNLFEAFVGDNSMMASDEKSKSLSWMFHQGVVLGFLAAVLVAVGFVVDFMAAGLALGIDGGRFGLALRDGHFSGSWRGGRFYDGWLGNGR